MQKDIQSKYFSTMITVTYSKVQKKELMALSTTGASAEQNAAVSTTFRMHLATIKMQCKQQQKFVGAL